MRFVYLDESGIGDPQREPYVVVAGALVHADKQLLKLERYLRDLVDEYVPKEQRAGFCFHARELMYGSGPGTAFDRKSYPEERRLLALEELCSLVVQFDLPLVMGFRERAALAAAYPANSSSEHTIACQVASSTACLISVERYMRGGDNETEVATLVYENNDQARKLIRETQNALKSEEFVRDEIREDFPLWKQFIPLQRIAGAPHFEFKEESSALQIADAVAYIINRQLRNVPNNERFFAPIDKQLIVRASKFRPSSR